MATLAYAAANRGIFSVRIDCPVCGHTVSASTIGFRSILDHSIDGERCPGALTQVSASTIEAALKERL